MRTLRLAVVDVLSRSALRGSTAWLLRVALFARCRACEPSSRSDETKRAFGIACSWAWAFLTDHADIQNHLNGDLDKQSI